MYGRLRGVPSQYLEPMVDNLLQRLGLGQYADRVCDSYSGGNKRKLSVAIALVGDPPAVLMDEPSTGMDPGAKRFLWDLIQKQVVDAGKQGAFTRHLIVPMKLCLVRQGSSSLLMQGSKGCFPSAALLLCALLLKLRTGVIVQHV